MVNVIVERRRQYGRVDIYPVCPVARAFVELSGRACLSEKDLAVIRRLGYTVKDASASS